MAMDNALWITWYDLPEVGRERYFSWLHETYIPALLRRPGYLWGAHYAATPGAHHDIRKVSNTVDPSVPAGHRYILMFGAEHANVFGNPVPSALHAELPEEGRTMLAMRKGERMNVMAEAARIEGHAGQQHPGMTTAPCIQLGNFNYPWQHEEELLAWFTQWRMPAVAAQPGCIRIRKLAGVTGWTKHAILYESMSVEDRNRGYLLHEENNPDMKAWSNKVVARTTHAPGSATLAIRIWPAASK